MNYKYTYSPSVPANAVRTYEPFVVDSGKMDTFSKKEESFKRIKQLGLIKMTPYSVWNNTTENFLLGLPSHTHSLGWPHCLDWSATLPQVKAISSYKLMHTIDSLVGMPVYNLGSIDYDEVTDMVQSARAQVVSDSYQTLDALTLVAESKETLLLFKNLISSIKHPLRSARKALAKAKSHKEHADTWLQYRYAIMPVIYSAKDIMQTLAEQDVMFKTSRARRTVIPTRYTIDDPPNRYITHETKGEVRVNAIGKAKYTTSSLRLLDQISFNPVQTAWELVPYSFVLDWFINVGDWIASRSLNLSDVASQRRFCWSVKENLRTEWYYHRYYRYQAEKIYDSTHRVDWDSGDLSDVYLGRIETVDSYERDTFSPIDIDLGFSPNLNLSRWLDAYALSLRPLVKTLKSLK